MDLPFLVSLRLLAAHGLVRRTQPGSWDRLRPGRYELTSQGRELAERLSVLDVWTELYEHYR
jgi:DNA-binding HxlR family transcriptional regulator